MFNKEEAFNQEIAPIVQSLKSACFKQGIPMFLSCAVRNENHDTEYISEMISPAQLEVALKNDRIAEMVKVLNGFVAVPETKPLELEFDVEREIRTADE